MTMRWDAGIYERVAEAQFEWALEVIGWRKWRGDEVVLDAGCGPGRVTEALLRRHPGLRVVAVDRDPDMLQKARRRLAPFGERVRVEAADLVDLPDVGRVDVVLSTAVLHWVPDHAAAFRGFHRVLRPGGEVLLQYGGQGNIASLVEVAQRVATEPAFARDFEGWTPPWQFDEPERAAATLRRAGFADVRTWQEAKTVGFAGRKEFLAFCEAAPLRPHLERLAPERQARYLDSVGSLWEAERRPWSLDYVRLNAQGCRS